MQDIIFDGLFNSENTKDYILSIQAGLGGFSFSIVSAGKKHLLAWKKTPLTITNENFLHLRFKEWAENEDILKKEFKKVRIIFDTKKVIPVPAKYYEGQEKKELMGPVFEIGDDSEIESDKVESQGLWLLYAIPKPLKKILSEQFPKANILHPLKNCLENLPKVTKGRSGLILLFSSDFFYTILFQGQRLLLANSFGLTHKNDVVFYALSVLKQFQTGPAETEVFFAGDIGEEEGGIGELVKYFASAQTLKPSKEINIDSNVFNGPGCSLYNLLNSVS